jgi:hypothetical protein
MPADILVLKREVEVDGSLRVVVLEAHITKQPDQLDGVTWVKIYEKMMPEKFAHCYIDTIDGELILNAIENYVRQGKGPAVEEFFRKEGRTASNPVTFRMKLDAALGGGTELHGDAAVGLF